MPAGTAPPVRRAAVSHPRRSQDVPPTFRRADESCDQRATLTAGRATNATPVRRAGRARAVARAGRAQGVRQAAGRRSWGTRRCRRVLVVRPDQDRSVVGDAGGQGLDPGDVQADARREVEVPRELPVAEVRRLVRERQREAVLLDLPPQVRLEPGVVEVTDHDRRRLAREVADELVRGLDLLAAQGVRGGQRRRVEGGHDDLGVRLTVAEVHGDEPLVGRGEDAVVQGLLQRVDAEVLQVEAVVTLVDREAEAVRLRRRREREPADGRREVVGVALLHAQHVRLGGLGQGREFAVRGVLSQVVADDAECGRLHVGVGVERPVLLWSGHAAFLFRVASCPGYRVTLPERNYSASAAGC